MLGTDKNQENPTGTISIEEASETLATLESKFSDIYTRTNALEAKKEDLKASYERLRPFLDSILIFTAYCSLSLSNIVSVRSHAITTKNWSTMSTKIWTPCSIAAAKMSSMYGVFTLCRRAEPDRSMPYFLPCTLNASTFRMNTKVFHRKSVQNFSLISMILMSSFRSAVKKVRNCSTSTKTKSCFAETNSVHSLQTLMCVNLRTAQKEGKQVFYILCGWMTESDAARFEKDVADDKNLFCLIESNEDQDKDSTLTPPTKLKNPGIFRPFELFVRMYGLPSYNEIDPTIFVALTYSFIFGAMFGDVGQGLCLVIGGALLYHFKKMELARCLSSAGVFSTIFGFLFGSFFGFEDVIPALWMHPKDAMTTLPFIGTMNTAFVVAIAFGMFLILTTMVLHIINAVRRKDAENIFFDTNGIAGFVFYGAIVAVVFLFMTGHAIPATGVLVVMFLIPLILIGFKEPLGKLVEKKADAMPKEKGMFLVTAFFELFDVLLSYFSNTLSFVRIGAFAVSHAL